ncbi:hypothetical protein BDN70DRAFT_922459 [Pholiota conissans]|uniref:Uncharacterized protein n=1 Tax=Pholiota conissans TaxID=109636 RepID=A0A9P6CSS3_9AGAR|nr:hypothetical protein BDN70DRAFT_922459 [Pholiota conissans]
MLTAAALCVHSNRCASTHPSPPVSLFEKQKRHRAARGCGHRTVRTDLINMRQATGADVVQQGGRGVAVGWSLGKGPPRQASCMAWANKSGGGSEDHTNARVGRDAGRGSRVRRWCWRRTRRVANGECCGERRNGQWGTKMDGAASAPFGSPAPGSPLPSFTPSSFSSVVDVRERVVMGEARTVVMVMVRDQDQPCSTTVDGRFGKRRNESASSKTMRSTPFAVIFVKILLVYKVTLERDPAASRVGSAATSPRRNFNGVAKTIRRDAVMLACAGMTGACHPPSCPTAPFDTRLRGNLRGDAQSRHEDATRTQARDDHDDEGLRRDSDDNDATRMTRTTTRGWRRQRR